MPHAVRSIAAEEARRLADGLTEILLDCVEGGASVSFMSPLSREAALTFWLGEVVPEVERGETLLFVAEQDGVPVGTVQLGFAMRPNQPHRADVKKLLVRTGARGRGIGEALMRALEAAALEHGRTVLVLDTASGAAERLYERMGWNRVGIVPDYALWPHGGFCDTLFMYKRLAAPAG
jgi:ribosomal protein S18 acetylase RimI-like enzyme